MIKDTKYSVRCNSLTVDISTVPYLIGSVGLHYRRGQRGSTMDKRIPYMIYKICLHTRYKGNDKRVLVSTSIKISMTLRKKLFGLNLTLRRARMLSNLIYDGHLWLFLYNRSHYYYRKLPISNKPWNILFYQKTKNKNKWQFTRSIYSFASFSKYKYISPDDFLGIEDRI